MKSRGITIALDQVTPDLKAVLDLQGVPTSAKANDRTQRLAEDAIMQYLALATPVGIVENITPSDFTAIYSGDRMNASQTALDEVLPYAVRLVLFACTVGEPVVREIARLFDHSDFAAGAMLDAAASVGADLTAASIEKRCEEHLRANGDIDKTIGVMRFSPGYCGWHISGQRSLFAALAPAEIGLSLNSSCLMRPLKSVSGVIIAAPWRVFDVNDSFPFCADCITHSCHDRFMAMRQTLDS